MHFASLCVRVADGDRLGAAEPGRAADDGDLAVPQHAVVDAVQALHISIPRLLQSAPIELQAAFIEGKSKLEEGEGELFIGRLVHEKRSTYLFAIVSENLSYSCGIEHDPAFRLVH